ncbi:MAG: CpsD/CapB family tyrosine-protein kinase [Candidatus Binatia bacterium]
MSKFYQALEKAEQERAIRRQEQDVKTVVSDRFSDSSVLSAPRRPLRSDFAGRRTAPESLSVSPESIEAHLVSLLAPDTFEAEQYRTLSYIIEQLHADTGLSVIAVSSPAVGDGKTTTAINLASTLTQLPGARVLLADFDLRRPCVSTNLGMEMVSNRGLVDFIHDPSLSLDEVLRSYPPSRLAILFTGQVPPTPYDVLKSSRLEELIEEARQSYDYIVLDTPPLIPFPDCRLIERFADGFVVVVAANKTPRKLAEEAIGIVDPEKVVGVVFNSDDRPVFGYYSHYASDSYQSEDRLGPVHKIVDSIGKLFYRSSATN